MKYIIYAMAAMFFLASCSKDNDETGGGNGGGGETGGVTDVTPVTSDLTVNLTTDKACYKPGETVSFTADALPAGAKIRYRTLNKVISEQAVAGSSWTWTAPATDFTGYLADVYRTKEDVRKSFSVLLPSMYPATGHAFRVMALSPLSTLLKRKVKFRRKWLF